MFAWDYNIFYTVTMTVVLGLVLGCWMFYTLKNRRRLNNDLTQDLVQCPYCAYLFLNTYAKTYVRCPFCQSILEEKTA